MDKFLLLKRKNKFSLVPTKKIKISNLVFFRCLFDFLTELFSVFLFLVLELRGLPRCFGPFEDFCTSCHDNFDQYLIIGSSNCKGFDTFSLFHCCCCFY